MRRPSVWDGLYFFQKEVVKMDAGPHSSSKQLYLEFRPERPVSAKEG